MKRIIALLLICTFFVFPVYSEEVSTFLRLKDMNDMFIQKMLLGGATAPELEAFLNDMDAVLYGFQEGVRIEDIDSFFITILLQTMQKEEHINVLIAFDLNFQEEMIYMLSEKKVPESMSYFKFIFFGDKVYVPAEPAPEDKPPEIFHPEIPDEPIIDEPVIEEPEITEPEIISPFSDVQYKEWYGKSIIELYNMGIVSGKNDGMFHPESYIKREEALKLVVEAFINMNAIPDSEYTPKNEGTWYYAYLVASDYYSLTGGIYDGDFMPDIYMTRQDFAAVAYRAALRADKKFPDLTSATDFYDINEFSFYAVDPVSKLQKAGIIKGVGDNKYAPANYVTRAEAAKIIYDILTICK